MNLKSKTLIYNLAVAALIVALLLGTTFIAPSRASNQINAPDAPGVTITETDDSTDVEEGGATDTYSVVLNEIPTDTVTVTITITDSQTITTFPPWNSRPGIGTNLKLSPSQQRTTRSSKATTPASSPTRQPAAVMMAFLLPVSPPTSPITTTLGDDYRVRRQHHRHRRWRY